MLSQLFCQGSSGDSSQIQIPVETEGKLIETFDFIEFGFLDQFIEDGFESFILWSSSSGIIHYKKRVKVRALPMIISCVIFDINLILMNLDLKKFLW